MGTIVKDLIGTEDVNFKDSGTSRQTFTRTDSTGRTLTLDKPDAKDLQFRSTNDEVESLIDGTLSVQYSAHFADLDTAISDIGATETTLIITSAFTVTANAVVPATMHLVFRRDGSLSQGSNTVTLDSISTGFFKIFDGTGAITFGSNSVKEVAPQWYGASPSASAAVNFTAIQTALDDINTSGGGKLAFPAGRNTYDIDCTAAALDIYSNITVDLGGNILHRTDTTNFRTMGNVNHGTPGDVNISVINGKITGVGANNVTTAQGSAISFYEVDGFRIENIETDNTTGDGIQWREAHNGSLKNIVIGDFGRNGISPTSGLDVTWDNVEIVGTPFTGANPAKDIDVENNSALETSRYYWNAVRARNVTFADLHTAADGDFAHEIFMTNCKMGDGFRALRFLSTNITNAVNAHVNSTNSVSAASANGSAVEIENVNNVNLIGPELKIGAATGSHVGVKIVGTVDGLHLINPRMEAFDKALLCFTTDRLNNAIMTGVDGDVYLAGSDNILRDSIIPILTLNGADTLDNIIAETVKISAGIAIVDSAVLASQHFGSERGTRSASFYSVTEAIGAGATYDLTVPLPDATGATNGRMALIVANYSNVGNAAHWANLVTTIAYGDTAQAERTVISTSNGGSGAITVQSVGLDNCVLRLAYSFSGNFSVTVIS